ncbi:MAG: tetratricopeptide repeat protein [Desulfobacterales bacterium]|nr:tetratricopeptide repeat protein [Desulfobacterales bacterium]
MPLLGLLSLSVQIYFAVHAYNTGRQNWIYIIIIFPGVGSLIYFFAEFLPDFVRSRTGKQAAKNFWGIADPGRELRFLRDQVERADSIKNRKALAEGCVNAGFFEEAISLYQSCMEGMYADDPSIKEGLCLAYFLKGDFDRAKENLFKLKEIQGENLSAEFDLLMARIYEESGDTGKALEEYSALIGKYSGEEARCQYALLLKKTGRTEEANRIFNEILKNVRLSPKYYKKTQKKWVDIAKKEAA